MTFSPPEPGESGCDIYTIRAVGEEGVDTDCEDDDPDCPKARCSIYDDPERSEPVTVKVWKCREKIAKRSGTFYFYFLQEGIGLRNTGYEVVSRYFDCNGDITTIEQQVTLSHGSLSYVNYTLSATHKMYVIELERADGYLNRANCGLSIADPQAKFVCSQTNAGFSYAENILGIVDKYEISVNVGAATANRNISVQLTSQRCCSQ